MYTLPQKKHNFNLSIFPDGSVIPALCTTYWIQDYVVHHHHCAPPTCIVHHMGLYICRLPMTAGHMTLALGPRKIHEEKLRLF